MSWFNDHLFLLIKNNNLLWIPGGDWKICLWIILNCVHIVLFCTIIKKKQLIEKFQTSLKTVFFCLSTFLILFRVVKNKSGLSYTMGKEIFVVIFGWGVIYNHKRLFFYGTWESVFISECHPNPGTQWGVGWILNLLCCSCSQVLVQVWQRHSRVCTGYITEFLLFLLSLYFLIPPLLL